MRSGFRGQAFGRYAANEASPAVPGWVERRRPLVQPESKFVNVTGQVLGAGVVINPNQSALKDRENRLDTVRGHAVADVLALAVIDRRVVEKQAADVTVGAVLIGMQRRSDRDVLGDRIDDGPGFRVIDLHRLGTTALAALAQAQNRLLTDRAAPGFQLFRFVLVRLDPANVGFVDLDQPLQHGQVFAAGFSQPLQDEPSGLLRDPYLFRELKRGYALTRRDEQVHGINPLVQRDVAALEYRAGAHREVLPALVAAVEAALACRHPLAQADA